MTPFVWRNRLVKLDDGTLLLSRAGRHDDWEFFPAKPHNRQAFAFTIDPRVSNAYVAADGSLYIETPAGDFVMEHDRVMSKRHSIRPVADSAAVVPAKEGL